ncbi:MAG: EamA family transporter [Pyrinomonadaceae bacterium]
MRDLLLTALAPITWGTTYFITTQFLPANRPLLVSVIRALPVGLLILAHFRQLPSGHWYWRALILGTLNIGLFFAFLFIAAYRLPGGIIATANAIQPFVVATLAAMFLGERLTLRVISAACAGAIGVGLIVLSPATRLDFVGVAAALAATTVWASGTVLTKLWGQPAPLLVFTAWQLVAGGLILLPVAILVEGAPPPLSTKNIAGFLYLSFLGTGLAYALWFRGIERLKASTVTFLTLLSPVTATTIDFLLLNRTLSFVQVGGVLMVAVSIFVAGRSNEKQLAQCMRSRPATPE